MSTNKERLQQNNINLQTLIGKANALPDAGSGGSAIETCTITISTLPQPDTSLYYVDGSMNFCKADNIMKGNSFTALKNSIIIVTSNDINVSGTTLKSKFGLNSIFQVTG